ncbi:type II toxin-antitoxin system RelE/ParE family toxin [Chryseobacterium sp.]|uniref:type II toxin-antitoxin system RelE/ParE family toxin n=1 Tax=Chryseobacterium sp. TaxID=1871047 RepID=UPI0011CA252D|nr:type II toxin-antitoxin system RelE/ParE family toxin [Chryseobacterium sp.]TXF79430.1 type II toxin-antitoxin system RelE/ParE family toxin [Chryseobacterium sp.]
MADKIIWTFKAKQELIEILQYWIDRNKSNSFSIKLNSLIEKDLNLILESPRIGRITDVPEVYVKVVHKYLLYYQISDNTLYVLTIRHRSKNPKTLKLSSE